MISQEIPPGWYPDPDGKPTDRYWNGTEWTESTRPQSANISLTNPPQPKSTGVDSNEIAIMVGIVVLILIVAFGYDY